MKTMTPQSRLTWLVLAFIAAVFFAVLLKAANSEITVTEVTGLNGVRISYQVVEVSDPRDMAISYCTPAPEGNIANAESVCIHLPLSQAAPFYQFCNIVTVPEHGPEVVCSKALDRYHKEGMSMFDELRERRKAKAKEMPVKHTEISSTEMPEFLGINEHGNYLFSYRGGKVACIRSGETTVACVDPDNTEYVCEFLTEKEGYFRNCQRVTLL